MWSPFALLPCCVFRRIPQVPGLLTLLPPSPVSARRGPWQPSTPPHPTTTSGSSTQSEEGQENGTPRGPGCQRQRACGRRVPAVGTIDLQRSQVCGRCALQSGSSLLPRLHLHRTVSSPLPAVRPLTSHGCSVLWWSQEVGRAVAEERHAQGPGQRHLHAQSSAAVRGQLGGAPRPCASSCWPSAYLCHLTTSPDTRPTASRLPPLCSRECAGG